MTPTVKEKLRGLPSTPGCYIMRDRRGKIIYVGKAKNLRRRVSSYFRPATILRGDPKIRSLVNSVCDLEWIVLRTEDEALIREQQLVRDHLPRYNILLRDDKRFLAIRADIREPFPRFTTCRLLRDDGARYFGPIPVGASRIRPLLDFIQRRFGLRTCRAVYPGPEHYRHCHDDRVRACSAPCVGRVTQDEYRARFSAALATLAAASPEFLAEVSAEMVRASKEQNFERAAELRDALSLLKELPALKTSAPPDPSLLDSAATGVTNNDAGLQELKDVLHLPTLPRKIICFDISNISGTLATASLVTAIDGVPTPRHYRLFNIRSVHGPDDPQMIAEAVRRHFSRLLEENPGGIPDLLLLDGGITQLRAAQREISALGLTSLPAAGLAERFEEIVVEGAPPLRLPRNSAALRIIIRLRDEAHRFAITHHRRMRLKKIRESALDEIPGVGPAKKIALLRTFGSVKRLSAASESAVASVPGIGEALAKIIKAKLGKPS